MAVWVVSACSADEDGNARLGGGAATSSTGGVGTGGRGGGTGGLIGGGAQVGGGGSSSGAGGTIATGGAGAGGSGGVEGACDSTLVLTMRDFTEAHDDFESFTTALTGIVEPVLGADRKPVYAHPGATSATSGPAQFDQWYRDVDGINMRIEVPLDFVETSPGVFVYDNSEFFPLDGMGFGNGPLAFVFQHNYLFTTEAHTRFTYSGGEVFTFRGDDDLWIFINGQLAVDLGGAHPPLEQTIVLDDMAGQLGITAGQTYAMDIFHAERHTTASNFRIETTIDLSCIENVEVDPQ